MPSAHDTTAATIQAWAVECGLRGTPSREVFDGMCGRLVAAGLPLCYVFAGTRTLHPQLIGLTFTWYPDGGTEPLQFERGPAYESTFLASPFAPMVERLRRGEARDAWPTWRRRLSDDGPFEFDVVARLKAAGATDYFSQLIGFGAAGDPARGTGIGFSFATRRPEGFAAAEIALIEAVLPAVALAVMADAEHVIAGGLLAAYLGGDAGSRVHAGAIERGSVQGIRAALWFADIRGFTAIADARPGLAVIDMLNEAFEALSAPLRPRGGEVLKFLGDGMLAIFPCGAAGDRDTCRRALDAAAEAMERMARLTTARQAAGKPAAGLDLALHLGEVLYGNVGAVDRLDFTIIGPAVNEVSRIEALCDRLDRHVLVSAEFAAALGPDPRLASLGRHVLRGVREAREIFGFQFSQRL